MESLPLTKRRSLCNMYEFFLSCEVALGTGMMDKKLNYACVTLPSSLCLPVVSFHHHEHEEVANL